MNRNFHRVLIVLLIIALGPPAWGNGQPAAAQTTPSCWTQGTVRHTAYPSAIMRQQMQYTVYLPPCYEESPELYPVVYLMHGSNSDDSLWINLGIVDALNKGISGGTLPPMIVVLPNGDWIANKNRFDNISWSNVFLTELMPTIEAIYRIDARRERRAIGGISRGGFWAFNIAYRHPELFSVVGGHSAYFALENAPNAYNPLYLARDQKGIDALRIGLDRGKNDYAFWGQDLMHKWLTQRKIEHTYTVNPVGEHDNTYWASHVPEYLAFYAAAWPIPASMGSLPKAHMSLYTENTPNTLFVPAVAFSSLQSNLPLSQLNAVLSGGDDAALVIDQPTVDALTALGIKLSANQRVVAADQLESILWKTPNSYTLLGFDRLTPKLRMLRVDESLPVDWVQNDPGSYPLAFASAAPNYDPAALTRFLMSGVTAITRATMDAFDANSVQWAGEAIRPFTSRADFFHISNEVSFHETCSQQARAEEKAVGPFCSKAYSFDLLPYIGVDIVELTGNHNLDFGVQPYLDTLKMYQDHKLLTVGGGATLDAARQPIIVEHNGVKIGMLACNWAGPQWALATETTPGAAWCDRDWLKTAIPQLKAQVDFVIVSVQYKETDQIRPPNQQQIDFHDLATWGADFVMGSQAHLTQAFEFYPLTTGGETFIHYGPGNLFFDQTYIQKRFFMDELFIYHGKLLTVNLYAGITDDQGRPRLMEDKERTFFMRTIFRESFF